MDNQNQPVQKNNIFIYLLVVFFAIFVGTSGFLVVSSSKIKKPSEANQVVNQEVNTIKQDQMELPDIGPTTGSIKLVKPEAVNRDKVIIDIIADSDSQDIVGFDVLIEYDPLSIDFTDVISLVDGFQPYAFKKDNRVSLTVAKTSIDTTPVIFKDTKVLSLEFKPKKLGLTNISILSNHGNEKTKLVNVESNVLDPEVNGISISIK